MGYELGVINSGISNGIEFVSIRRNSESCSYQESRIRRVESETLYKVSQYKNHSVWFKISMY